MRRQLTNLFLCPHLELKGYSGKMYLKTFLCQSGLEDRSEIQRLGGFLINLLAIATDSYFFEKKLMLCHCLQVQQLRFSSNTIQYQTIQTHLHNGAPNLSY